MVIEDADKEYVAMPTSTDVLCIFRYAQMHRVYISDVARHTKRRNTYYAHINDSDSWFYFDCSFTIFTLNCKLIPNNNVWETGK